MPAPRQPTILGGLLVAAGIGGLLGIAYGVGPGAPTPEPSRPTVEARRPSVHYSAYDQTYEDDDDLDDRRTREVAVVAEEVEEEPPPEDIDTGTTEMEPEPVAVEEVTEMAEEEYVEEPAEPEPEPEPEPIAYPPPFIYIPPTYIGPTQFGQTTIGQTQIGQTVVSGPQVPRAIARVPPAPPLPNPAGWRATTPADVPTGTHTQPSPVPPGVSPPNVPVMPPGVSPPNTPVIPPGVPVPPR